MSNTGPEQTTHILRLFRGMPGAGKSTRTRYLLTEHVGKWKAINKDTLRAMLDNSDWGPHNEFLLNGLVPKIARHYLRAGFNVLSDNMNLDREHVKSAIKLCQKLNEEAEKEQWAAFDDEPTAPLPLFPRFVVEVVDIVTPLEVCIARDAARPEPIGEAVIKKIYDKYTDNGVFRDLSNLQAKHPTIFTKWSQG